ncbi:unnamed protein product [Lactuca saligna]|uniref:RRM domain-containing protein n=1 Tax=Lactuca saligna TaxID=75948 RepID=A0AA35YMV6_LACSI|nr:unnamed protein product [Lactuca saligna]
MTLANRGRSFLRALKNNVWLHVRQRNRPLELFKPISSNPDVVPVCSQGPSGLLVLNHSTGPPTLPGSRPGPAPSALGSSNFVHGTNLPSASSPINPAVRLWITNWWRNLRGVLGINQVVRAVLESRSDKTKVHLIYANVMGKVGPSGHLSAIETGTKFYISNLDYSVSNADIKELFAEVGDLKKYSIHYDRSGRSKGMAMILYSSRQDALATVKRYNNVQLDGKPMNIKIVGLNIVTPVAGFSFPNNSFGNMNGFPRRCNILKRVPNSSLWLLRFPTASEMRLRAYVVAQGVQPDHSIFTDVAMKNQHIRRNSLADLCLDT